MSKESNQHILVYVRCRPLSNNEKKSCSSSVVDVSQGKEVTVRERLGDKEFSKKFIFDTVFGPDASQIDVYNVVAKPCIQEVLLGYNCTIFAYGQTGTGKTHTMQGVRSDEKFTWEEDPESGIIPRTLHHLFDELQSNYAEYTVRVSFLELYNEELNDLLTSTGDGNKLRLYEDISRKGSVVIQGLSELTVTSKDEVYNIMELGANKRVTASTAMNDKSSRSHTIFSVTVHIKECTLDGEDILKIGKLNLVDLAGSECIGRSGAVDRRAREAGSINQSLLTLGRVITALVEKTPHIPYRESKLTRLLQDSLGGRTKTSIVATISPAACNLEETLSTLDYAYRAKNITNKPEVNQKMTKKMLIREYTEEIERLRRDLIATAEKNGIFLNDETYNFMQNKLAFQDEDIKQKQGNIEALSEELERFKLSFDATLQELTTKNLELKEYEQNLQKTSTRLEETRQSLVNTTVEREEQRHLVQRQMKTEKLLTDQSLQLMTVADESTGDVALLHDKLARKNQVEAANSQVSENFRSQFQRNLLSLEDHVKGFVDTQDQHMTSLINSADAAVAAHHSQVESLQKIVEKFAASHNQQLMHYSERLSREEQFLRSWVHQTRQDTSERLEMATQSEKAFLENKIDPLITAARSLIKNSSSIVKRMGEMLAKESRWVLQLKELRTLLANKESIVEPLLASNKEKLDFCRNPVNILGSSHKRINLAVEKMFKEVERFSSAMAEIQEHLEQTRPVAETALEQISKSLLEVEATNKILPAAIDSHLSGLEQTVDELTRSAKDHNNHLLERAGSDINKEKELNHELRTRLGDIEQETLLHARTVHQSAEAFHSTVSMAITTYEEGRVQYLNEREQDLEKLNATVEFASQEHKCALREQEEENKGYLIQHKTIINSLKTSLTDIHENIGRSLHTQLENVDRFMHEELAQDISTGLTPQRKDYLHCQDLVTTSPHERIIQRFRDASVDEITQKLTFPEVPTEVKTEKTEVFEPPVSMNRTRSLKDLSSDESKENSNRKHLKSKGKQVSIERSACNSRKPLAPPNFHP